jgi:hypothetical protein
MMKRAIVITTINNPTSALKEIASRAKNEDIPIIIIGDTKTPPDFRYEGLNYYDLASQNRIFPDLSNSIPVNHYSRKNLGYLIAIKEFRDISVIQETDDDNIPYNTFWNAIDTFIETREISHSSNINWCNIYSFYTSKKIWPRGFPLELINEINSFTISEKALAKWQIIQGLADQNPDVDAIYRLTSDLPLSFSGEDSFKISSNLWCPFNSQNTMFSKEAFPLLYLPSYCSFRMTDIWRSFIAQRCLWENNNGIVFTPATVYQERNDHNLMKDFEQETIGYLKNLLLTQTLSELRLTDNIFDNILLCYESLVQKKIFPMEELLIVNKWLNELKNI